MSNKVETGWTVQPEWDGDIRMPVFRVRVQAIREFLTQVDQDCYSAAKDAVRQGLVFYPYTAVLTNLERTRWRSWRDRGWRAVKVRVQIMEGWNE